MKYSMTEAAVARNMTDSAIRDKKASELRELESFIEENSDLFKKLDIKVKEASENGLRSCELRGIPLKEKVYALYARSEKSLFRQNISNVLKLLGYEGGAYLSFGEKRDVFMYTDMYTEIHIKISW